jgi:hypothetical protein
MMNMAAQQRTSQLQAERTRQEMDNAAAQEARAAQTQTATMREKDVDFQLKDMKRLRNIGVAVLESGNEEAYQSWLGMIDQSDKQFGDTIRQVAPTFNAKVLQTVLMEADKYIDKSVATPVASLEVDVSGNPRSVTVGGLNPQQSPVFDAPPPMATAPRGTPTAPQAAPANPMAPGYKPNTAAADPGSLSLVINSALETGVMAKTDFDKMLSLAPPESRAKIAAWVQQNNIQVAPDVPGVTDNQMRGAPNEMRASPMSYDGQTPKSQFAVYRGQPMQSQTAGLSGAPEMQQTLAQTQPRTITKLQRRDPNVSPLPGSSQVPLERVAGEAEARRETPAQITQRKNAELLATEAFEEANKDKQINRKVQEVFATKRAEKDADFLETYTDTVSKSRATLNALDQMIGDARIERDRIVIPKGGRRPHGGFEGVVGAGIPGVRFIPGTQAAGFDALLEQVQGGAFLKAFNDLRGGGAITQIEGEKATTALTRVRRAQSEIEFVKAAREFVEILRNGIKNADKRYARLTGEAPPAAAPPRKTPTKGSDGWGKAKVVGN